jgi:hypothetical protein
MAKEPIKAAAPKAASAPKAVKEAPAVQRVTSTRKHYHDGRIYKPGEVMTLRADEKLSKFMTPVDKPKKDAPVDETIPTNAPEQPPEGSIPPPKAQDPD